MNYETRINHFEQRKHREHGVKGKAKAEANGIFKKPSVYIKKGVSYETTPFVLNPRKTAITEKERAEILEMKNQGIPTKKIAEHFRVSGQTILNHLKKAEL